MPERARLIGEIEVAARSLSPYWPLPGFVAINPLRGWEDQAFARAVESATRYQGGRGYWRPATETLSDLDARWHSGTAAVNRHLILALSAFCDQGQAAWTMPNRHHGLYRAWRAVALHDPLLPGRRRLRKLPDTALACLQRLMAEVPAGEVRIERLRGHLHALPGWSAFVRWRAQRDSDPWQEHAPVTVVDLLAVRLALCHCLDVTETEGLAHAPADHGGIERLQAREARWRTPAAAAPAAARHPSTRRKAAPQGAVGVLHRCALRGLATAPRSHRALRDAGLCRLLRRTDGLAGARRGRCGGLLPGARGPAAPGPRARPSARRQGHSAMARTAALASARQAPGGPIEVGHCGLFRLCRGQWLGLWLVHGRRPISHLDVNDCRRSHRVLPPIFAWRSPTAMASPTISRSSTPKPPSRPWA